MSTTKTPMTDEAARRIQSDADRNKHNEDFKGRAQRAAEGNSDKPASPAKEKSKP